MILMNIVIDNFFSFYNFQLNTSYPRKISGSFLKDEHLKGRPNFRYKKVNILMGANATGKATFGHMLMNIFHFIEQKQSDPITDSICDPSKEASFSMDFILNDLHLYRIIVTIDPLSGEKYESSDIHICINKVAIRKNDHYESCRKRLDDMGVSFSRNYPDELEKIKELSWYPDLLENKVSNRNEERYLRILGNILKTLDPSIQRTEKVNGINNTFVIRIDHQSLVIQDGEVINEKRLSGGTSAGIAVANMIEAILDRNHCFYYCDELFSNIHSDVEKTILTLMIDLLGDNDQLFFTTHNLDILDLNLPKHSYTFLRKDISDPSQPIKAISTSSYLGRNKESLRNAVENDLFLTSPDLEMIYNIGDFGKSS